MNESEDYLLYINTYINKSMADKYTRVTKEQDKLPDNEIRVKRNARIGRYLRRANDLLTGKIQGHDSVVIKGVSNAMESAVKLAELIKHRVKKIYQVNSIANIVIVDEYAPLEEGLDHLKFERNATMLTITLSKSPLDTKDIGYQDPIPDSEVQEFDERAFGDDRQYDENRPRGDRRGGRGGRGSRGGLKAGFRGGRGGRQGEGEGRYRGGDRDRRPRTENRREREDYGGE